MFTGCKRDFLSETGVKIPSNKGIGEAAAVSHLISLDEFFGEDENINAGFINTADGRSGVNRGSDLVNFVNFEKKKYRGSETPGHRTKLAEKLNTLKNHKLAADVDYMLTHISTCMSSLLDYSRTGISDSVDSTNGQVVRHDDEVILYKAIARLMVTTFTIFKNINSALTPKNKIALYDKMIDEILDKKKWRITETDAHFVQDSEGADKAITNELLKEGVAKFADIDFAHGVLRMKGPDELDLTDFQYCTAANRPKGGAFDPNLTGSRSGSGKLKAASPDVFQAFDERMSSAIYPSTPIASNKSSGSTALFQDDSEEDEALQEVAKQTVKKAPANSPSPNSSDTETLVDKSAKAKGASTRGGRGSKK